MMYLCVIAAILYVIAVRVFFFDACNITLHSIIMMNRTILVTKDNALVRARYSLSLIEHRFINMCIGAIFYTTTITPSTECVVKLNRFANEFDITDKEARSQFTEISNTLITKKVTFQDCPDEQIPWVTTIDTSLNNEFFVKFHEDIIPYISRLESNFTKYNICIIKKLRSMHSIRLYEICKSVAHEHAKWRLDVELEELKLMLGLEGKYRQYGAFKRMLDTCIFEINDKTDLIVNLHERKKVRR